ncbi:upper zone of growth plate and cartilage matrix associated a [Odontesthes bonariensis]|uniref:upper zone of growth plate and cartilage matrix associated a n=1 Tax=Odontesthes bonariensis TaxID=219752 RepID=UPI003F582EA3
MSWIRALVLSLLSILVLLAFSGEVRSAAVPDGSQQADPKGAARQVFVPESEASNFFNRRSRRSVKYYEFQAEQRQKRVVSERMREYNEDQRNAYENYAEEDRNEISERSSEMNEQLREYHYDGLHPRYHWFH